MKRAAWRVVWYWAPLVGYAGLIFYLSAMPNPPVPPMDWLYMDKLLHFLEYAGLGALLCRALALGGEGLSAPWAFLSASLLGALYGASDELHQMFVPQRSADQWDLLVDFAGAVLGSLFYWGVRLRRRSAPRAEMGS